MITLISMEAVDFQHYLEVSIREYGEEHVRAGNWQPSEALERSLKEFEQLLPNGLSTENNYIYTIFEDETREKVGVVWFAVFKNRAVPRAFVYDFRIEEQHRRKGYATQALARLDERVRGLGIPSIGLHVFAHNQAARELYEKAGYQVMSLNMLKNL